MEVKRYDGACRFSIENGTGRLYDGCEVILDAVELVPCDDTVNIRLFGKGVHGALLRFCPIGFPEIYVRKTDYVFDCSVDGYGGVLKLYNAMVLGWVVCEDGSKYVELSCDWATSRLFDMVGGSKGLLPVGLMAVELRDMFNEVNKRIMRGG